MPPKNTEVDLDAALAAADDAPSALLSEQDIAEAKALAKKRVIDAQRKKAKDALIEEETLRLQNEDGFSADGSVQSEIISVTLDLAPHQIDIKLDGITYLAGQTYRLPRHKAGTIREIMQRGWQHQDQIDGKSLFEEQGRRAANRLFSAGQAS